MKLLVFDGNSIVNRAFFAIKNLNAKDGTPTNAIYGFLKLYFKYFEMSKPDMVAVAFDVHEKTFRHLMYSDYKAQRKGMPDDLFAQMGPLHEILSAMNVKIFELGGYEADDIIGTLSAYCEQNGYDCDIVSGDRDDFQLVSDKTRVIMPVTRGGMSEVEVYTYEKILEKYGFEPKSIIDLKAIMGDSSDNIKGVAGIGEKGATELIQSYKTLESVYENLENIKPALQLKLENDRDNAFMSKTLATIKRDVPIEINDDEMRVHDYDNARLYPLLQRLELTSLVKQMDVDSVVEKLSVDVKDGNIADSIGYFKKNGLYFIVDDGKMIAKTENGVESFDGYYALLTDDEIEKFTFKPKMLYREILKNQPDIKPFYDVEVCQYVINPSVSDYSIYDIFTEYTDKNAENIGAVVDSLPLIVDGQKKIIKNRNQEGLTYDIEFPLTVVLADMENVGITVDSEALKKYSDRLDREISEMEKRIYFEAGEEFNINSPKQLGVILFEKLGLPTKKKTKTGYSTNVDVLEDLADRHEIVADILTYRKYAKLKSTYCEGLLKLVGDDNRIHSSFNQTVTQTGRISSTEPNLQNIPVRTELGRELRAMFVSPDDKLLIDADYSQIELRVLAHIANDENMQKAFKNGDDIHAVTASSAYGVPLDFVTPEMRRTAKAINFGIVYGISDFSLAKDIHTTKKQAGEYIQSYLNLYSGVRDYMKTTVENAHRDGYVLTLSNRRRDLPELNASNFNIRSFGERAAMNTPIQGTAADIIKIAMVNVRRALIKENLKTKLILQVHDELILEAPDEEKDKAMQILTREMENAMHLNVKLVADATWGRSWYECK